jgi:hypothetical protein
MNASLTTATPTPTSTRAPHWSVKVLTVLLVLFLVFDGVMKLIQPAPVQAASAKMGFSHAGTTVLGLVVLVGTLGFVLRCTSILGAILLTGYLGGAVACQLLTGAPTASIAFPIGFAALLWLSWLLRGAYVPTARP